MPTSPSVALGSFQDPRGAYCARSALCSFTNPMRKRIVGPLSAWLAPSSMHEANAATSLNSGITTGHRESSPTRSRHSHLPESGRQHPPGPIAARLGPLASQFCPITTVLPPLCAFDSVPGHPLGGGVALRRPARVLIERRSALTGEFVGNLGRRAPVLQPACGLPRVPDAGPPSPRSVPTRPTERVDPLTRSRTQKFGVAEKMTGLTIRA